MFRYPQQFALRKLRYLSSLMFVIQEMRRRLGQLILTNNKFIWHSSLFGFEILAEINAKIAVFWATMPCSSDKYRRFGVTYPYSGLKSKSNKKPWKAGGKQGFLQIYFLSVFRRNRNSLSDPVNILCETTCACSALHVFSMRVNVMDTNKPIFLNLFLKKACQPEVNPS
jgi:hypothetical protein